MALGAGGGRRHTVMVAALLWRVAVGRRAGASSVGTRSLCPSALTKAETFVSAWRRPASWGLTVTFACHSFSYFAMTAWFPTILADLLGMGTSAAGLASSVFQVAALAGSFGVPLALRFLSAAPGAAGDCRPVGRRCRWDCWWRPRHG